MDSVGNNKRQHQRNCCPTRITQIYQGINQVESTATTLNKHQQWIMNIHEQFKVTHQLIYKFIHDNIILHSRTITQHTYLTKTANTIIDKDTGKEFNYHHLSKNPKHKKIWKESFTNELKILSQGEGQRLDGIQTMLFVPQYQ